MAVGELSARDVERWRSRPPVQLLRVGVPVAVGLLAAVAIGVNVVTVGSVTLDAIGLASDLDAVAIAAVLTLTCLAPFWPYRAVWWAVPAAALVAVDPWLPSLRWPAAVLAVALAGLAVADIAGAARQRAVAAAWGEPVLPALDPQAAASWTAWRWRPVLIGGAGLLMALAAAGLLVHDERAARDFRDRATVAAGVVVSVSDDEASADVEVDGRTVQVPISVGRHAGEPVTVRYDTAGSRAELVDDVFDPAGALVPATAGLLTALVVLGDERSRRRRALALLTQGGPAMRCRAAPDLPVAARRVVLAVGSAGPVLVTLPLRPAMRPHREAPLGGVLVVGLACDGDEPVLRSDDGRWWTAAGPAKPASGRGAPGATRFESVRSGWTRFWAQAGDLAAWLVYRTPTLVPVLVAVLVAWFWWWALADKFDLRIVMAGPTLGWVGARWVALGRPMARLRPGGMLVSGTLRDEGVPWDEVASVASSDGGLVVRLRDDTVVLSVGRHGRPGRQIVPRVRDPQVAAGRLQRAREERNPGEPAPSSRPSPELLVGLAWVAAAWVPAALRLWG